MADRTAKEDPMPALPEIIHAGLGVFPGLRLKSRLDRKTPALPATIDPDSDGRRFLVLDASDAANQAQGGFFLLRILPLSLEGSIGGTASLGRWRQEWSDLAAAREAEAGTISTIDRLQRRDVEPPVLPPLYYCPEKTEWIVAICPECEGPRAGGVAAGETLCPACGSPRSGGGPSGARATSSVLEALWRRVRRTPDSDPPGTPGAAADPACVRCDRRERCYPVSGPSSAPGTAGDLLVPLSTRPWGGAVIGPLHLPLTAWMQLAAGSPWATVRRELKGIPEIVLEEVDARFREERPFLFPPDSGRPFLLESLLLKIEALRQALHRLESLVVPGHPHLGLKPESIWVRMMPPDSLRTVLWASRLQLIDLAPGWQPEEGSDSRGVFVPPADRPTILRPPGCADGGAWADGMCLVRPTSSPSSGDLPVEVDFLPQNPFERPPAKGDGVCLEFSPKIKGGASTRVGGKVSVGFPEVCRVMIDDSSLSRDKVNELIGRGKTGAGVRLRVERDHSLVDDLFALGTLWLSLVLEPPGDLLAASRLRDEVTRGLTGGRAAGVGDRVEGECLRVAEANGLLPAGGPRLDRALLGRSLAIGMRLCGAIPGTYPCQNHEPAGIEERSRAYSTLIAMVVEFGRDVREGILHAQPMGDEILVALGSYARERASLRTRARQSGAAVPRKGHPMGGA